MFISPSVCTEMHKLETTLVLINVEFHYCCASAFLLSIWPKKDEKGQSSFEATLFAMPPLFLKLGVWNGYLEEGKQAIY